MVECWPPEWERCDVIWRQKFTVLNLVATIISLNNFWAGSFVVDNDINENVTFSFKKRSEAEKCQNKLYSDIFKESIKLKGTV